MIRSPARWWDGRTRMLLFVFGGLLVLQRSDTLDPPKLAYFAVAAVAVLGAATATWRSRETEAFAPVRPWFGITLAILLMIALSLPVALAHGVGLTPWLRAAAPYGLFAVAPVMAFDARRAMSTHEAAGWMSLAGALAAISFAIYWLGRRQIADLGIEPLVLPSAQLAYAGFAVAVAYAFHSRQTLAWAVVGGLILGALLITGARTTLLLIAVPAVLGVMAGRAQWRRTAAAIGAGTVTTVLFFFATIVVLSGPLAQPGSSPNPSPGATPGEGTSSPGSGTAVPSSPGSGTTSPSSPGSASPQPTTRPELIGEHLGSVGTILVDPASGQSLKERIAQTQAAFVVFEANPVLGAGPGYVYDWTNSSGVRVSSPSLDTPLMVPAEFGLVGIVVTLALVGVFAWFVRFTGRRIGRGPEGLSVAGVATTFGLTSFLGPPMDDKGAAYALALVLTIALASITSRSVRVEG